MVMVLDPPGRTLKLEQMCQGDESLLTEVTLLIEAFEQRATMVSQVLKKDTAIHGMGDQEDAENSGTFFESGSRTLHSLI